jgi:uncharacterized membrane protein YfcA
VTLFDVLAVIAAGLAAGAINAIVGSGSLVTFPVLLAIGLPSVTANVSNTIGLACGNFSAAWGYREELRDQLPRVGFLSIFSALGAATGAALLLLLPSSVFDAVVPALILLACVLMATRPSPKLATGAITRRRTMALAACVYAVAVYGGYFGAAQGVILLASLRLLLPESLQRLNGLKNAVVGVANGLAAIGFALFAHVNWNAAGLIAVSSIVGASFGARYGRQIPDQMLRIVVITVGVIVAAVLIVT